VTRVLVVDDDEAVREALTNVLLDQGFRVEVARDGLEALAALARPPLPDVILLDGVMPVMDGLELRRLLLADPGLAPVPVVFLSADGRLPRRAEELRAQVLSKPVMRDALLAALRQAAGPSRPQAP